MNEVLFEALIPGYVRQVQSYDSIIQAWKEGRATPFILSRVVA